MSRGWWIPLKTEHLACARLRRYRIGLFFPLSNTTGTRSQCKKKIYDAARTSASRIRSNIRNKIGMTRNHKSQQQWKQCERTNDTVGAITQEDSNVRCVDDITGKELPWTAVRRAREEELKYLRDTRNLTSDTHGEVRSHTSRHKVDRHWQCWRVHELLRANSRAETPLLKALKAVQQTIGKRSEYCTLMCFVHVSTRFVYQPRTRERMMLETLVRVTPPGRVNAIEAESSQAVVSKIPAPPQGQQNIRDDTWRRIRVHKAKIQTR